MNAYFFIISLTADLISPLSRPPRVVPLAGSGEDIEVNQLLCTEYSRGLIPSIDFVKIEHLIPIMNIIEPFIKQLIKIKIIQRTQALLGDQNDQFELYCI